MLRQRWGNDYNANMGLVAAGLKKLGGPDGAVGHYLDATGLGIDPAILLTLAQHVAEPCLWTRPQRSNAMVS